jgi:hypothetical protein
LKWIKLNYMKKSHQNLYVIKKYVWAKDIIEALRKEKTQGVDDIWMDDKHREEINRRKTEKQIGFMPR